MSARDDNSADPDSRSAAGIPAKLPPPHEIHLKAALERPAPAFMRCSGCAVSLRAMGRASLVVLSALIPALAMGCGGGSSGGSSTTLPSGVSVEQTPAPRNEQRSTQSVYAADRPGMLAR